MIYSVEYIRTLIRKQQSVVIELSDGRIYEGKIEGASYPLVTFRDHETGLYCFPLSDIADITLLNTCLA